MLNRVLEGFEDKLTNAKWAAIIKTSSDTALRDLTQLVERGVLVKEPGGGRSTSYALAPAPSGASPPISDGRALGIAPGAGSS